MVRAFILIEIAAGNSSVVVNSLQGRTGIIDVVRVTGPVDAVATVEAPTIEEVSNLVGDAIHPLAGVLRTTTCVALMSR